MGRKVVWTDPAAEDVVDTVEYIAKDSPSFAATLAQRICDAGDSLEEFSERGRPYPDPAYPGFRELVVVPYRLVYEVEGERVVIHGVFHGSRQVERAVRKRATPRLKRSREMTHFHSRGMDHRRLRRGARASLNAQEAPLQDLPPVVLSGPTGRRETTGVLGAVMPGGAAIADTGLLAAA